MNKVKRIFVEKKAGFDIEAQDLLKDLRESLQLKGLKNIRILNRYDIQGIDDKTYNEARYSIFAEPTIDNASDEAVFIDKKDKFFITEFLPGQYDQRADSAAQCIQILSKKEKPLVRSAKVIILQGEMTDEEFKRVKDYYINPVDSKEAGSEKYESLDAKMAIPDDVAVLEGFIHLNEDQIYQFRDDFGLAMANDDLLFVQSYFKNEEKRNPTVTEIRVLDTYWSDHCRHTTFLTEIAHVDFDSGQYEALFKESYKDYLDMRNELYKDMEKSQSLMDIAVIGMKYLKKQGKLDNLDESEEINACSIVVKAKIDGREEDWLVMFKNETHNHPTEIEPFGGAATCLGGAIRDPLSGRSYVYQAMRVTGSGDPRTPIEKTLEGKLPQRKITTEAARGYSSYGNQIGIATGQVSEVYDEDFVAKRMEVGAVIAAAPKENVIRKRPGEGDHILLLGGRTGRDGCGGATGSSKEHTEDSILESGAEVQKGNPPTERNIQRLFRRKEVAQLIKRCNDFGAGGVSVAIGELADSIEVNLDLVLKKYEGLDGTELAISESQERMAVVVNEEDVDKFISYADEENLEAVSVARVTDDNRFRMNWRGKTILDLSRSFIDTNGVKQKRDVRVAMPEEEDNVFKASAQVKDNLREHFISLVKDLNIASQKGMTEHFDSTIGKATLLMPLGGRYQLTPAEGMAAKLPVTYGESETGTLMTYGYNPMIAKWSPYHGALYAVIDSVTKIVAMGGDYKDIRLSFQEYFEKLGEEAYRWGKPFIALLGALKAQKELEIAAIGGKDSMSGTFLDLDVPPTLISFAVSPVDVKHVLSPEFKKVGSKILYIPVKRDKNEVIDFSDYKNKMGRITNLIHEGKIVSAKSVGYGGIGSGIFKMAAGNKIGIRMEGVKEEEIFELNMGSMLLEIDGQEDISLLFEGLEYKIIGETIVQPEIQVLGHTLDLNQLIQAWEEPLESIFRTKDTLDGKIDFVPYTERNTAKPSLKMARPRVLITTFPGTNCEEDSRRAFEDAGAVAKVQIFRNLTTEAITQSLDELVANIKNSQILMIPGGFSGGDEPDGSAKFITSVFRNEKVREATMDLIQNRDGLILGICNGFQALIKLGLVPYGEIKELTAHDPTLAVNKINRHVSTLVRTKIVSVKSPWFSGVNVGDIHTVPVSHGEGRFIISDAQYKLLLDKGQIATQYVDLEGNPTYDIAYNPNGSYKAIEGITSMDGRILGKMAHSERKGSYLYKNVIGNTDQKIFESGVLYFK